MTRHDSRNITWSAIFAGMTIAFWVARLPGSGQPHGWMVALMAVSAVASLWFGWKAVRDQRMSISDRFAAELERRNQARDRQADERWRW